MPDLRGAGRSERAGHTLWLLPDFRGDWPGWPNGMANAQPPLCLRCARISTRHCPALRSRYVAVRARSVIVGVSGELYLPGRLAPVSSRTVTFGDPHIRWVLAAQVIRELRDCTLVEL